MMNIQTAIRQMRVARRLGKISNEVQTRIMRRLRPRESELQWERLMALRASIERDIQPIIAAKRAAERDCFDIKYMVVESKAVPVAVAPTRKVKPALTGYEYTPAWWKEAEQRERAAKKAGTLVEA